MIGQTISHFRIQSRVGGVGPVVVYRALDEKLRRPVALGVFSRESFPDETRKNRILQDARAAAAVKHKNLATIYEIGEDAGTVFITMEWIDGKPLRAMIDSVPSPTSASSLTRKLKPATKFPWILSIPAGKRCRPGDQPINCQKPFSSRRISHEDLVTKSR